MERLQGIAVSPGVAIGEALVLDNEGFRIPRRFLPRDAVEEELARLDGAMKASAAEVERNRDRVAEKLGAEYAAIFSAHLQMLHDRRLREEIEDMIRTRHYSPEYSVSRALRKYAKVFESLDGEYMAERANDIYDIEKRLLRHLLGASRQELAQVLSPVLVLARNLTPSETANLNPQFVRASASPRSSAWARSSRTCPAATR
jgi:phosphotransferase system enzyme I (PtsI)